ncbi:MAG: TolC family protein [Comamonadaceae bacterium]|nr:TolC family protein [Comamonadaceae bacterium]
MRNLAPLLCLARLRCCSPAAPSAPTTCGRRSPRRRQWRIDYAQAADVGQHALVAAVRRPGARPADRRGAAREPRPARSPRRASTSSSARSRRPRSQFYPQIGYSADASRSRASRVGQPPLPPGADPYYSLYQGALGAQWQIDLFGRVRRQTEAAQAQVYASEQGRRGVVLTRGDQRGRQLHRAARARPAARDRARHRATTTPARCSIFELRFKGGVVSQVEVGAGRVAVPAGAGGDPGARAADRRAGEPDLRPARPQPGADPARQDDRPARRAGDSRRPAVDAAASGGPTSCRPSRTWSRPTPTSAWRKSLYYPTLSLTGVLGSISTAFGDFLDRAGGRLDWSAPA